MSMVKRGCELCHEAAAVYCAADEAHICWTCDAKVHSANFLVARHTRAVLCGSCGIATSWRVSGVDFAPLTGFCPECAQRELQGECTSNDDGNVLDTGSATVRTRLVEFCSLDSGYETGCSSSNAESCEGEVVVEETVRATPCESTSQLSSEESVSSGISMSLKRKRLDCGSSVSVPQRKQIATKTMEDVNRSVAHRQCDSTTSSSSSSQRVAHANQDASLEVTDWNLSQSQELSGYSNRVLTALLLPSAKHQRMDVRSQVRPSLARHQQSAVPSTARLMRMLAKWHWDLHLSSPGTVPLALRLFRKVTRALAPAVLSNTGVRVTVAACLRLASGLDEAQIAVPKGSEVAACAGVSVRRLAMTEFHLLALLGWRRFRGRAGTRT